jgi:hypothetical protein
MGVRGHLVPHLRGQDAEARLGEGDRVGDISLFEEGERLEMQGASSLEVPIGAGLLARHVPGRRDEENVMPGQPTAVAGDERAPLRRQLVVAAPFRQRDEEARLRGGLLAHAEPIEEDQTALDVPIRLVEIAAGIGQHSVDPLDSALHEEVVAAEGVGPGGVGGGAAAVEVACSEASHGLDRARDAATELIGMCLEHASGRDDQGLDFSRIGSDPCQSATGQGEGVPRLGIGDGQLVSGREAQRDGLALAPIGQIELLFEAARLVPPAPEVGE